MKRLLVLFLAIGLAGAVQAQSTSLSSEKKKADRRERAETPEERAKLKTMRLAEELKLSDKQQNAVYEVLLSQETERERHQLQREEARKRAQAEHKRSEQKILEILDENQKELYEKRKAEMKEQRGERMEHRREYQKRRPNPDYRVSPQEKSEEESDR